VKWQKVMLTHTVHADVLHDYKFIVPKIKCSGENILGILVQATKDLSVATGDSGWCVLKTIAIWVLADCNQEVADRLLHSSVVVRGDRYRFGNTDWIDVAHEDIELDVGFGCIRGH